MHASRLADLFFFSSRRRHTRYIGDWSSDVCSSDLVTRREKKRDVSRRCSRAATWTSRLHDSSEAGLRSSAWRNRSEERRVGKEWRSGKAEEYVDLKDGAGLACLK